MFAFCFAHDGPSPIVARRSGAVGKRELGDPTQWPFFFRSNVRRPPRRDEQADLVHRRDCHR